VKNQKLSCECPLKATVRKIGANKPPIKTQHGVLTKKWGA